ncbi:hypothetical protein PIB30_011639 [Stylosanthes scabra]|uniref:Uncharacterized protein n=1 Tax=Stylosanthes scabra TaxID=79078 RepID=A0ABU6W9F1_9FABA|nr:hypothetical protein [Stylosanthes scabra]
MNAGTQSAVEPNAQAMINPSQVDNKEANNDQQDDKNIIKKKRLKTSAVWNDFVETEVSKGVIKALCKYLSFEETCWKLLTKEIAYGLTKEAAHDSFPIIKFDSQSLHRT